MPSTATQVIAAFRRIFPDCDPTTAQTLFVGVHRRLLTRAEVRNKVVYISLTSGTREYDLDTSVEKIHEAYLERSSDPSDWLVLFDKSISGYIDVRKGWRTNGGSTSDPQEYYVTSAVDGDSAKPQIGFNPVPQTSTSGTYPRVALYVTAVADISGSETVPSNLLDDKVYTYGMAFDWATERHPEVAAYWEAQAEKQMNLNVQYVKNAQSHTNFQLVATNTRTSPVI